MADKDYKVQVGVEATANTGALDKVNKGWIACARRPGRSTTS